MEFGDSRNAMYADPNAYIQRYEKKDNSEKYGAKKVVFQQPYDCMSNYYINNDFKKSNGEQVRERKEESAGNSSFFDFKNLMPLLNMFGKSDGGGLGNIVSKLTGEGGFNFANLLPELIKNKDLFSSILGSFGKKKNSVKKEIKSTDFEIKNYTRVE